MYILLESVYLPHIMLQEARCIARCKKAGVSTPTIYHVDTTSSRLYLEHIDGMSIKKYLNEGNYLSCCSEDEVEI